MLQVLGMEGQTASGRVLVVDANDVIADLVCSVLTGEGFLVSTIKGGSVDAVRVAVNHLEPDCVLLDGEAPAGYGRAWLEAAWLTQRARRVPVIMFSAGQHDVDEARDGESDRAIAAGFAGILSKPFDLDDLVGVVRHAVGLSVPFYDLGTALTMAVMTRSSG